MQAPTRGKIHPKNAIVKNITSDVKTYNISVRGGIVRIPHKNITYIESNCHKIIIHTTKKDYICYRKLTELAETLKNDGFLRCHQCIDGRPPAV